MNLKPIVHFPNLNGMRFIAAFVVLIHHIEQYRNIYKQTNYWNNPTILRLGEQGVTLFFVLSGFLITYLLLIEKGTLKRIHIPQFYIRRILRIWPLYFLIVFLSFFVFPKIQFLFIPDWAEGAYSDLHKKLFLFAIVTPNIALTLYGVVPYLSQSWSIGTEEQFYLFWPWIIQKSKHQMFSISAICIAYILLKYFILLISEFIEPTPFSLLALLVNFLYWFRIESMFIGSVFAAILYLNYKSILAFVLSKYTQWVTTLLLMTLLIWGITLPLNSEVYSLIYAILILGFAVSPNPIVNLDIPILNFLGRISYGLYMLQSIAVVTIVKLFMLPYFQFMSQRVIHLLTFIFTLLLLIILASISYYGFEKIFLKLKNKFMLIKSQN